MAARELVERKRQRRSSRHGRQQAVFGKQAQIHGHLVVAAAAHVHTLAERTELFRQPAFHRQMDILIFEGDDKPPGSGIGHDPAQLRDHRARVLRG